MDQELDQKLTWVPLAYDGETIAFFLKIAGEENVPIGALPPELVQAMVLRLSPLLAI